MPENSRYQRSKNGEWRSLVSVSYTAIRQIDLFVHLLRVFIGVGHGQVNHTYAAKGKVGFNLLYYYLTHAFILHATSSNNQTHTYNFIKFTSPSILLSVPASKMYAQARPTATILVNKGAAAQLSHALHTFFDASSSAHFRPCATYCLAQRPGPSSKRRFTTTPRTQFQEKYFPPADTKNIKITPPAWHHPIYTEQQMNAIQIAHREKKTWSDSIAYSMLRLLRFGMDTATGYSHPTEEAKKKGSWLGLSKMKSWLGSSPMTERKWLVRFLFLESVAGVPGMVAGSVRHLHSLRRLKRDNGWIETLLEEAYNERMHLLTFMKMAEPGRFMKLMIIGAQGVFYNMFFMSYLFFPRACHRFVGYLEEEAVLTYTRVIGDIEAGKLPKWQKLEAPEIAVRYWNMPEGHRTMKDLLLYIRADEAKHREVNHTLGNLEQQNDPNPFVSEYEDAARPHPSKGIENIKSTGWNREEVI